jgi:hypothetical protein
MQLLLFSGLQRFLHKFLSFNQDLKKKSAASDHGKQEG